MEGRAGVCGMEMGDVTVGDTLEYNGGSSLNSIAKLCSIPTRSESGWTEKEIYILFIIIQVKGNGKNVYASHRLQKINTCHKLQTMNVLHNLNKMDVFHKLQK